MENINSGKDCAKAWQNGDTCKDEGGPLYSKIAAVPSLQWFCFTDELQLPVLVETGFKVFTELHNLKKKKEREENTFLLHLGKIIFASIKIPVEKKHTETKSSVSKSSLKLSVIQILKLFNLNSWQSTIIASFISGIALQLLNSLASKSRLTEMLCCLIWHYS